MTEPLRIALIGLGTVGTGVIRLLQDNAEVIAKRAGRAIEIEAVSARDRNLDRGIDLSPYKWVDDLNSLATDPSIDVVVELIGGSDGPAYNLAQKCLAKSKPFVTANKAMIAHHGMELAALAEKQNAALKYEAAVAGGVPIIKALSEGASANAINRIYGILNGTCNYILTTMEKAGRDFSSVLGDAQKLGYAEADPSFDIGGVDAAHKLSILAALAFGTRLDFGNVEINGIEQVMAEDIGQAQALGYRIRLVGMARMDEGKLFQRVNPYLIPEDHPLAHIDGSTNAVVVEGNHVGRLMLQGAGAGDGPTASAVVADIIDVARGNSLPAFAIPSDMLSVTKPADFGDRTGKSYIRFVVADKPGVLAEITAAMRDADVSIESLIQTTRAEDDSVMISLVTHECRERDIASGLDTLMSSKNVLQRPVVMHLLSETD